MTDTIPLSQALTSLLNIPWDVAFHVPSGVYSIDGIPVNPDEQFMNTADFSGDTSVFATAGLADNTGFGNCYPEVTGQLLPKFARAEGFLLQAETNFTEFAEMSFQAAGQANWNDGTVLAGVSPAQTSLRLPSGAVAGDLFATGYRSRMAWLCTPAVSALSVNGSYPITLPGEVINWAHVGIVIASKLQFLRMAPPTGITVGQLTLLSS